jgi:hypothetical protein
MEYYQAIGDPRGTALIRYFMTEDEEVRANALPQVQHFMNSLVVTPSFLLIMNPSIDKYQEVEPLLFEPGTGWAYGRGTDWAGQLVNSWLSIL